MSTPIASTISLSKRHVIDAFNGSVEKNYLNTGHSMTTVKLMDVIWNDLFKYIDDLEKYCIHHSLECNKDLRDKYFNRNNKDWIIK